MYTPSKSTEKLAELAIERAKNPKRIIDLCTGNGWIAEKLKDEFPKAEVWATDVRKSFSWRPDICWKQTDLLKGVPGKFDLIVMNPPYMSQEQWEGVGKPTPKVAYTDGKDGFTLIERLIKELPERLNPGGICVIEFGTHNSHRLTSWEIVKDHAGFDRYAIWYTDSNGTIY